mgnify:CR=1 FL=1|tara:strand:+ start:295 stop:498 length:204 start_codon:yes stop_codon:yes gene_type:complete
MFLKKFKVIEVPLLFLIIASFAYETLGLTTAIVFVVISIVRLVLNSWGFDQFYDELSDECEKLKNKK